MQDYGNIVSRPRDRRSFLKTGLAATGAATMGTALLARATAASAQTGSLTAGDAAMLQFLAAGEALEADFYTQYNELGGIQDAEVPGGTAIRSTPTAWRGSIAISLNTFTTPPTTRSAIRTS